MVRRAELRYPDAVTSVPPAGLVALVLVLSSCESMESVARERAARELDCPPAALAVRPGARLVDGQEVTATGCRRSVTYSCGRRSVRHYGYTCGALVVPPAPRPTYNLRPAPGPNGPGARVLVVP
jgi:hypothetical protein